MRWRPSWGRLTGRTASRSPDTPDTPEFSSRNFDALHVEHWLLEETSNHALDGPRDRLAQPFTARNELERPP